MQYFSAGCSRGSWFDVNSQTCEYCPMGSYQELSGKLSCDLCPNGYTTLITGSKDRNDCICKFFFQILILLTNLCIIGHFLGFQ